MEIDVPEGTRCKSKRRLELGYKTSLVIPCIFFERKVAGALPCLKEDKYNPNKFSLCRPLIKHKALGQGEEIPAQLESKRDEEKGFHQTTGFHMLFVADRCPLFAAEP